MTAPASKLLQPITVGPLELKNRIMFPPLTTGYEERDGSIGERSLAFYERLARGGVSYIVIGDVAPVMTASPTPKLATDAQIPTFKALADAVHKHGAKVALQLFHPEYDVPGVGRMVMGSMAAAKAAQEAKAAGDEETFAAKMAESNEIRNQAYAKLHHDMQHFVNEASVEQLTQIKEAIAASAARAQQVITFEIFQPLRIADDDRFRDHTLHLREMVAARAPKNGVTDASAVPQALKRAAADAQQRHDLFVAQPHVRSVSLFRPLAFADITRDTVYFFHQLFISGAFHRDDFHNLCFLFPKQRCRFATACFHVSVTARERFSGNCGDTKKPESAKRTPQAARKPET